MKTVFREITLSEFKKFAAACPSKSYMQSPAMYQRYQKNGREAYLLGVFRDNEIVVAGIASVIYQRYGKKIFTFSRGPLADYQQEMSAFTDFLVESQKFLKARQGIILQISPNALVTDLPADFQAQVKKLGFKYLGEYEQVKWIYTITFDKVPGLPFQKSTTKRTELLKTALKPEYEQTIMKSFHKNHRYTIRYATDRYDLRLRILEPTEYNILFDLIKEAGQLHGFVPRNQEFYEELAEVFGNDVVAVVAEMPDGTPTAVGFFILYGDEVIYLSSGMRRDYKKFGGPHLIQWEMIKYAYTNGYRKYNFWGTDPDPENGVFRFKQGFNGNVEEFTGTFAAALSPLGTLYLKKLHAAEHRSLQ